MRFFILLLTVIILASCHQKTISFDVSYPISDREFRLQDTSIIIEDFPLYFQANVEKNHSKKSLIQSIELIGISSPSQLQIHSIDILNNNNWENITTQNVQTINATKTRILANQIDFIQLFKKDKISLRINLSQVSQNIQNIVVTFRFKGKQEKTNTQFRIIA